MAQATMERTSPISAGESAPDFTLPDQNDREVTLSSFLGKKNVVLAFYPFAFSGVCTKENACFTQDMQKFEVQNAVPLGISTDHSFAIKAWVKQEGYKHSMLSDQMRTVSKAYGLFLPAKNAANRATVIVDKYGKVAWVKVQPELGMQRDEEEILKVLEGLK